jgi:hypothetical protein
MRLRIAAVIAFGIGLMTSPAYAVSLDISNAVLSGGANYNGGKIHFPGTAVFDLDLTANQQYTISVTGHTNDSDSFFNFFFDPDGAGGTPEYLLVGNLSFEQGHPTFSLPSFTAGVDNFLRITSDGTNRNFHGQIEAVGVAVNAAPVPGPVVGAGLPGLLMTLGGFVAWRRRRNRTAAAA